MRRKKCKIYDYVSGAAREAKNMWTILMCVTIMLASPSVVQSQSVPDHDIPDSAYVPNELIVWFNSEVLNEQMVGGYGERSAYPDTTYGTESLPLTSSMILSESLLEYLQNRGVIDMFKVVPWIDALQDTLSITRHGDTVRTQQYWNMLRLVFDPAIECDMIEEMYLLMLNYYGDVIWAQPNLYLYFGADQNPSISERMRE